MSADPLLQPFKLKHLTIRNRLMSTAHEPAYTHDGMPKERYRAYHVEKAKGGIGLTMIGGSAVVAPDSPQAFGNILLYKDEVVGWLKALADEVHAHGDRAGVERQRTDRFRQRDPRPHRHRRGPLPRHSRDGRTLRAAPRFRRRNPRRVAPADLPRGARAGCGDGAARHRIWQARH